MIHFLLALIALSRHEHEFVLQLPQILQRIAPHLMTIIMLLWNLQPQYAVKTQLLHKKEKNTSSIISPSPEGTGFSQR